jgi:hypothetical protein
MSGTGHQRDGYPNDLMNRITGIFTSRYWQFIELRGWSRSDLQIK